VGLGELDSTLIAVIPGNGLKDALSDETEADKENTDGNRQQHSSFGARAGGDGDAG
jgi:hypothetical protein